MLAIVTAEEKRGTEKASCDLANVVRAVHAQFAAEATRRHMRMEVLLHAPEIPVRLSEAAASEAVQALVSNAFKYTPDSGRIRIRTESGPGGSGVQFAIGDSGIGIPDSERTRIFEPFFRSSTARRARHPGVGLGLAFVRSVVVAAGGSVAISRSDLGGAEFTLDLPPGEPTDTGDGTRPQLRVVIVGGVTAGPKAAAKISRLNPDASITIVERGSALSYAGCGLPYYVSGVVRDQQRLMSSSAGVVRDPAFFRNVLNVQVLNQTDAVEIDRGGKRVRVRDGLNARERWLPYDKLLLATGASAAVPESLKTMLKNVFTLHGVRDAEGIKIALSDSRAREVVIVGGGLIGIEMTEALVHKGARVTILESRPRILPVLDSDVAALVERHLEGHGVRVVTGVQAQRFEGDGAVSAVVTDKGTFPASLVILAVGIRPNTELARGCGLEIGETGALRVDDRLRTSDPDIYAAGDCAETRHLLTGKACYIPLGSTATKQGRVAAINIAGGEDLFPGIVGSCICRVFDHAVGRTGLGESEARDAGFDAVSVLAPGPDRAHFMPTSGMLMLKLVVDRRTRRILGLQATGPGAADKRIDVAAMAIASGMTVDAMAHADLCYAPPYSTAMDNIITAANIARNKLDGLYQSISPEDLFQRMRRRDGLTLLDVRTPEEHEQSRLPGSLSIPLGALRGRVAEISREQDAVVYCDVGLRGYEAALMLHHAGFTRVKVLEGGLAMWPYDILD
jgi:NADPH-dependent 2,4-dienoyl-CoA reductase/sulfur reductase-like enzyme/rhodanese-related sulfurtransferase/two-component sensor histidine kinase